MLGRTYTEQRCSVARALEVVGQRWTLLILRDVLLGMHRFEQLQDSLGVATNVLTDRLQRLSDEGLLERRVYRERPRRHEYVPTEKGRAITPAMIMLMKWGDRYYPGAHGPPRLTIHRGCGGHVDDRLRCERCEAQVDFGAIEVRPGPGLAA